MSMTNNEVGAMELMARREGGHPWNWTPLPESEIRPNIWYTWADPSSGKVGRCLKKIRGWAQAPVGDRPVVLRRQQRPRPRDQIGYLLRKVLLGWNVKVGAERQDFVKVWIGDNLGDPLVLIQNRMVSFCVRDSVDETELYPYRVVEEIGPYKGRGWTDQLILDVYRKVGMYPIIDC